MPKEILDIAQLKQRITQFIAERDWQRFQTLKNIAMALTVESAELLEIFQWLTEEESFNIKDSVRLVIPAPAYARVNCSRNLGFKNLDASHSLPQRRLGLA